MLDQAVRAGATLVKDGHDTDWGGYAGYFQDLDGQLWEAVWNPELLPDYWPVARPSPATRRAEGGDWDKRIRRIGVNARMFNNFELRGH